MYMTNYIGKNFILTVCESVQFHSRFTKRNFNTNRSGFSVYLILVMYKDKFVSPLTFLAMQKESLLHGRKLNGLKMSV